MEIKPTINYDEFSKVDLRVAQIISAERVEGSDKLLKLEVRLGELKRQIIAGLGKKYAPENLIDKSIIIVANLEPRQLMGLTSEGMVLAADSESGPVALTPLEETLSGSIIK
ncbi:MAG: methionyl-tRNA synthetase [Patescibacteria group bacterium]|nr:methionyl-tRNA synthetase [Patescibacteria group bacterium]